MPWTDEEDALTTYLQSLNRLMKQIHMILSGNVSSRIVTVPYLRLNSLGLATDSCPWSSEEDALLVKLRGEEHLSQKRSPDGSMSVSPTDRKKHYPGDGRRSVAL